MQYGYYNEVFDQNGQCLGEIRGPFNALTEAQEAADSAGHTLACFFVWSDAPEIALQLGIQIG